eukprot:g1956.t1
MLASAATSQAALARGALEAGKGWLGRYNGMLETRPLQTKLVTSMGIFGVCELNAQLLTSQTAARKAQRGERATLADRFADVKWGQVAGFACFAFYNTPVMHAFFGMAAQRGLTLRTRVLINSLVIDPVNISVAMMLSAVNKGKSFQEAFGLYRERFVPTMQNSFLFWPPAHVLNNFFVPVHLRVLGFTTGSLVWNNYLCWSMQRSNQASEQVRSAQAGAGREKQAAASVRFEYEHRPRGAGLAAAAGASPVRTPLAVSVASGSGSSSTNNKGR